MNARALAAVAAAMLYAVSVCAQGKPGQDIYNQAQAAFDRQDWPHAISGFQAVLAGLPSQGRTSGIIRSRFATALLRGGKTPEAVAQARQAVAALAVGAPPQDDELAAAYLALGEAARFDLKYADAIAAYAQALAHASPAGAREVRWSATLGTMLSSAVIDPALAARSADAVIADHDYFDPLPKKSRAQILAIRARIELNRGNPKAALPFLKTALTLNGALSQRVSLGDVSVLGDAALVYQQLGDDENTRLYLTYAGAGHLPTIDWLGGDQELPVCGADLPPDDTAVIEFAIGDDGRTTGAAPIYVSRPGEMGLIFAEAVRGWRWDPEAVAKLDPFWRASVRLQLRCVTRPPALQLAKSFGEATAAWLHARGVDVSSNLGASNLSEADLRGATGSPELTSLSQAIKSASEASDPTMWGTRLESADAILRRLDAPTEMRALTAYMATAANGTPTIKRNAAIRAERLAVAIPKVDAMPGGARAGAWLRTERAIALETAGRFDEARPMLTAVEGVSPATLPDDDPIRKVATLHLSLLDRRNGDAAGADARLTKAGLSPDQCELFDVRPVPANVAIAASQFPAEALRWRFEGYVRAAFDIAADGSVGQVRTVIAYPPFVFAAATEKAVARFRYIPPTIGGAVLGCTNQTQSVRYQIPN